MSTGAAYIQQVHLTENASLPWAFDSVRFISGIEPKAELEVAKTVLVVEDEPDIRRMLELALGTQGYSVLLAQDGQEGLDMLNKSRPDLAILDVKMPRMNGFELLVEMRKSEALKDVPVIMLTSLTAGGNKSDETWRNSLEISDFLSKPFDTQQLLARVNRILNPGADRPEAGT